jgi:hypothetical protein
MTHYHTRTIGRFTSAQSATKKEVAELKRAGMTDTEISWYLFSPSDGQSSFVPR